APAPARPARPTRRGLGPAGGRAAAGSPAHRGAWPLTSPRQREGHPWSSPSLNGPAPILPVDAALCTPAPRSALPSPSSGAGGRGIARRRDDRQSDRAATWLLPRTVIPSRTVLLPCGRSRRSVVAPAQALMLDVSGADIE